MEYTLPGGILAWCLSVIQQLFSELCYLGLSSLVVWLPLVYKIDCPLINEACVIRFAQDSAWSFIDKICLSKS